jgi:hypothetical protein
MEATLPLENVNNTLFTFTQTSFTPPDVSVPALLAEWVSVFFAIAIYRGKCGTVRTLLFVILHDGFPTILCLLPIAWIPYFSWSSCQQNEPSCGGEHTGHTDYAESFPRFCKAE